MSIQPNFLPTLLSDVLGACEDAFAQTGAPAIPSRSYLTHGTPVVEGEQLTVQSLGLSVTHPFPLAQLRAVRTTVVGSAGVSIEIWRSCWPMPQVSAAGSTLPHPSKFGDAAATLALDASTLWGWMADLAVNGGMCPSFATIGIADDVSLSPLVPLGPLGGLAGWRLQMAIKISVTGTETEVGDLLTWISGETVDWSPGDPVAWET